MRVTTWICKFNDVTRFELQVPCYAKPGESCKPIGEHMVVDRDLYLLDEEASDDANGKYVFNRIAAHIPVMQTERAVRVFRFEPEKQVSQ